MVAAGAKVIVCLGGDGTAREVRAGDRTATALVDVCVSRSAHVGSRALWDPNLLTEPYCDFARRRRRVLEWSLRSKSGWSATASAVVASTRH